MATATAGEGHDMGQGAEAIRLATEAWGQIGRLFLSQQDRRDQVAAELGLLTSDLIALFHFQPDRGVAQRDLADHWSCDPSWVTNRIDRLEHLELVERRVSTTDRRVKLVWLTEEGAQRRQAGLTGFGRPPDVLGELSLTDLRALARILAKLDLPDPTRVAMADPAETTEASS